MSALPSDIARASDDVRRAFSETVEALSGLMRVPGRPASGLDERTVSLALTALCVGGLVLARTVHEPEFAEEIRLAARSLALVTIDDG